MFKYEAGDKVWTNFSGEWVEVEIVDRVYQLTAIFNMYFISPNFNSNNPIEENWLQIEKPDNLH